MAGAFKIVVIDDDSDLRKLVRTTLQFMAGWDVATAATGPEGIEAVRRLRPDVVAVDFMMPGMDGLEVCRRLKADPVTQAIPVVMLSGRLPDEASAKAAGAAGVITKPFEFESLADLIVQLCGLGRDE